MMWQPFSRSIDRLVLSGAVPLALALLLATVDARAALTGWLAAATFASALPLGALCLTMMLRIIPGPWREELAPPATSAMLLLPLLLLAAVPIFAGLPRIYVWTGEALDGFKGVYLTPAFFILRSLFILGGACLLAVLMIGGRSYALAVGGLIAFVVLHGILATDWLLSLDPDFHSSGFGLYFLSIQTLSALCLLILMQLTTGKVERPALLGGLLLTALLLWAYLAFMQYLITWSGNLPAGVSWYQRRASGTWKGAEYAIAVLRLAPAFLLLFPPVQRSSGWLAGLSLTVLLGSLVECAWLTLPTVPRHLTLGIVSYALAASGLVLCGFAVLRRADRYLSLVRNSRFSKAGNA
ncbi:hypothetical protein [Mycoplana dimorpha]|uniref:Uncharacterized protein n=1 Tax=Mycoplana dimorpha TaxID=28320 RepID=A0A2T5AJR4_MYCDI|nr:hypothetical protein [Mycoplana dimorpha]PTM86959.1 hypothetical protein C7449_11512 [Mycoplana dimorpha]